MWLSELKTTDFKPNKKYTFVISLGATEQHGPFLPLGTDTIIHDAIVKKAEEKLKQVIFLPTLAITCSEEHKGFPGSVWVTKDTMNRILRDICDSLKEYAGNIIFISWHGGNISLLDRFVEQEKKTYKSVQLTHLLMEDELTDKKTVKLIKGPIDEHAGNTEISMVLAINSKLVQKPGKKKNPKQQVIHDWEHKRVIESSLDGIIDQHPRWVVSKEIGKQCLDMHSALLVREIKKIIK